MYRGIYLLVVCNLLSTFDTEPEQIEINQYRVIAVEIEMPVMSQLKAFFLAEHLTGKWAYCLVLVYLMSVNRWEESFVSTYISILRLAVKKGKRERLGKKCLNEALENHSCMQSILCMSTLALLMSSDRRSWRIIHRKLSILHRILLWCFPTKKVTFFGCSQKYQTFIEEDWWNCFCVGPGRKVLYNLGWVSLHWPLQCQMEVRFIAILSNRSIGWHPMKPHLVPWAVNSDISKT